MDVVGLEDTTQVGLVRLALAQAFDCRLLVAESLKEGEWKLGRIERLLSESRNSFLDLNRVHVNVPRKYASNASCLVRINSTVRSIASAIHLLASISPYRAVAVRTNSVLRLVPSAQSADRAVADIIRPGNVR
jgi:hypothetical protein